MHGKPEVKPTVGFQHIHKRLNGYSFAVYDKNEIETLKGLSEKGIFQILNGKLKGWKRQDY